MLATMAKSRSPSAVYFGFFSPAMGVSAKALGSQCRPGATVKKICYKETRYIDDKPQCERLLSYESRSLSLSGLRASTECSVGGYCEWSHGVYSASSPSCSRFILHKL